MKVGKTTYNIYCTLCNDKCLEVSGVKKAASLEAAFNIIQNLIICG